MPLKLGTQDVTLKLGSQDVTAYLGAEEVSALDPTSIEGLVGWYDSLDLTAMAQNSDGTGAVAVGDQVGYWADKSGGGNHVTQATAANRPTLTANKVNGKAALTWDGSNDNLSKSAYTAQNSLSGLTRIFVFSCANQVSWISRVFDGGGNGITVNGNLRLYADNTNYSGFVPTGSSSNAMPLGIYSAVYANSSMALRQDGVSVAVTSTVGTIPATTAAGNPTLHIGSNIGANQFLNGPIAEYIIYNRGLSDAELTRVEAYLRKKWGFA